MTVPFEPRPNDPDADHLNALLDAMRSGTRAPDAASMESPHAADLADAADQLRGLVRRADAPAAAYLVDHPLQNRWEDIMSTAFPAAPPAAATGETFAPTAPVSNRTRRASAPPAKNRLDAWLSAAIVALMLLGTVGGAWWLGPGRGSPSDDGRTRLAAVTQDESTPQAVTGAPAKITDLLSAVPADMPGQEEGPNIGWTYADVEQQLANMGFTPEEAVADPLQVIGSEDFASIAWASGIFHYSTDEEFVAAIGFNPFMARQVLGAFTFHDSIIVLRGDWDVETLTAAWEAAGYTPYTTASGVTAWTIGPNGEVDPTHPIQSKGFQSLNNVAILDGGILVYAGTMETLELAIAAHAGEAQSARDDENIAPMLATVPEDTVSLVAFDQPGSAMFDLERQIEINPNIRPEDAEEMIKGIRAPLVESREAVGPMPDYHGVLFGITSESGENGGEVILRLGAASEEDAAQIATVIEWRWDNFLSARSLRPLNTVMTVTDATHEGTTAMLTFDPSGNPRIWRDLLHSNDLMPFAVDREDADASASPVATPES